MPHSTGLWMSVLIRWHDCISIYLNSEHYKIAEKIQNFLNVDEEAADNDFIDSSSSEGDEVADDFEHIEQSDVVDDADESGVLKPDDNKCDVPSNKEVPTESQ